MHNIMYSSAQYMILQMIINLLYAPNVLQNRILDELGLIIIVFGFVASIIHFVVRHVNPPIKEDH